MKKIIGILSSMVIINLSVFAQNDVDVLRYSQTQVGGTARSIGFGGAMGSIGADFSTLNVNPAGIGLFKKSEFSITPTLYLSNLNAEIGRNNTNGFKDNFNLNEYGIVFAKDLGNKDGWKYFQFGIGVNRTNNFNHYYHITNDNHENSLLTDYQVQAFGKRPENLDPFSTDLAWYHYLLQDTIRTPNGVLAYTSPLSNGGAHQELKSTTWGSMNEMNLTMGSTLNDIFYIGGSVGFPFVRYFEESSYTETDLADTIAGFQQFTLDKSLETHGSGVNFKVGIIVRPTGYLRIGISYHSPTYLQLTDEYSSQMTRIYENGVVDKKQSPNGEYNYRISTPMKLITSATITLANMILISGDLEYINYSSGKLKANDYAFFDENAEIRDKYKPTLNIRAGAELLLQPISFRVGFGRYGNPYQDNINEGNYWVASGGLGYRNSDFFVDLGVSYTMRQEDYYMYNPAIIEAADLTYNNYRIAITTGVKF